MTIDGRMFIAGERRSAAGGATLDVLDPATGAAIGDLAAGGPRDVDEAVMGAREAFAGVWGDVPPVGRAQLLTRLGHAIRAHEDELAQLESLDVGKPLREARADVAAAAAYFEFYAGLADKVLGTSIPLGRGIIDYTVREPIGVSAQIVPWNYPLQLGSRGIAPALACGNAVVVKPAEEAGLSLIRVAELAREAGLPNGVLNIVTGSGEEAGAALSAHPGISHVTFTGSVETGIAVMTAAARNVVPVTLELGGKSPAIIFADADIERAAAVTAAALIQNAGQTCSAASRLLVERSVAEHAEALIVERFRSLRLGRGLEDPDMGPLVSERQLERALGLLGMGDGAEIVTGGRRAAPNGLGGFFLEPTLVRGGPRSALAQQEVFGPVITVTPFDDVDEAISLANGTPYGLVAGVWTRSLGIAHRVSAELEAGQVFVNSYGAGGGTSLPFGGYKRSGFGREKGLEALANYTQVKNVCINYEGA